MAKDKKAAFGGYSINFDGCNDTLTEFLYIDRLSPPTEDEQGDDRVGYRRDQRDRPLKLHGYEAFSGPPRRVSRRAPA